MQEFKSGLKVNLNLPIDLFRRDILERCTVLEQVRAYLSMIVQSLGYEVESEPIATTALVRLRAGEPFDLLLSDVVMLGMVSGRPLAP